jgi:hypothetical protein
MRDETVMHRGDNKMKRVIFGTLLLALVIAVPISTMARVDVNVSINLPPPIMFAAPPALIVLPETYVYVVPDIDEDIFFYNGWWWRPWEGRWYRSRHYDSGWARYGSIPSFYRGIPSGWRNDYRDRRWGGRQWDYQQIPHEQVQRNWSTWEKSRHWEKQNTWGVQGLKSRTRSPQPSRAVQPKSQAKPQVREVTKSQHQEARPQSQEVQPQHSQQQQGNREKGKDDKKDKK